MGRDRAGGLGRRSLGFVQWCGEDGGLARVRRTEDGVDDVVCFFKSGVEVVDEWDGEVAELGG